MSTPTVQFIQHQSGVEVLYVDGDDSSREELDVMLHGFANLLGYMATRASCAGNDETKAQALMAQVVVQDCIPEAGPSPTDQQIEYFSAALEAIWEFSLWSRWRLT